MQHSPQLLLSGPSWKFESAPSCSPVGAGALFGEGVLEGRTAEAERVSGVTDLMSPGAGSYKYADRNSVGILSFTAVQFMWPSFRELVGVLPCSPGWRRTCSVARTHASPSASTFQVLRLQVCATITKIVHLGNSSDFQNKSRREHVIQCQMLCSIGPAHSYIIVTCVTITFLLCDTSALPL